MALCALDAWVSLATQVHLLIGSRGLLPVGALVESLQQVERPVWPGFPSFLLFDPSDAAITTGIVVGGALSLLALLGVWPRLCLLLSAPLYLSYVVAGREFLSFQWDSLLIECLVVAAFIPRDRPSAGSHWIARALLFKLYFESGIAKAQSTLGDWFDGSAMTFYYETAPLPAWPAWWAHQLPELWHEIESFSAMGLETLGAFLILGPRPARLAALAGFTGFQILNLGTSNYGFFVYLALALHVFLLDDTDLERISKRLGGSRISQLVSFAGRLPSLRLPPSTRPYTSTAARFLGVAWLAASVVTGIAHFAPAGDLADAAVRQTQSWRVYRVVNAYHLFGHITRERIEPEFQTRSGDRWQAHDFHYKPGDPFRAPPFVAPHQPRVDFRLWFYGLDFERGAPRYVANLLRQMCSDPEAVAALFATQLPSRPEAVRIEFWRYHFTTRQQRDATRAWWQRQSLGATPSIDCARFEPD